MPAHDKSISANLAILLKALVVFFLAGTCGHCYVSGNWDAFIISAPFALGIVPGYFNLLPRGGMRHGSTCYCREPDIGCELKFWFEIAQKVVLLLPILLLSIFLHSMLISGVMPALVETGLALLVASYYFSFCAICIFFLISLRRL
jgi:hypothetical protein